MIHPAWLWRAVPPQIAPSSRRQPPRCPAKPGGHVPTGLPWLQCSPCWGYWSSPPSLHMALAPGMGLGLWGHVGVPSLELPWHRPEWGELWVLGAESTQ